MLSQLLDKVWIANHIPHQGNMCLLDRVQSWDQSNISCIAISHRNADNPLRAHGQLGIACGIEYAAQAMAIHGALSAPSDRPRAKVGYLLSVREMNMYVTRLDDIASNLLVNVTCIIANETNMLYEFIVSANDQVLLDGRAAVMLNVDSLQSS